ncbi:undecaprenyl-phosphate glucose phosphotransferase [Paraburkholderia unamae]|uniref:Colanic acid biosynthesis UDP-glucose lipid carrier transferase n=1 Tax=Paraburkholderia unamae TaxID=219649 RepID=A0ABX5KQJ2_9BURK|nr:undecaprenyl-phosphate glucose phosphotransferase [Paraburkholderia unamae]PVX82253.1 putative colanic acid biosynthesis UDP-glucose lipid carrier transferase [Paraburkholderia unamae]CAG9249672.1 Putative colanic acid biosysnthesis UDP-glucose lipid carrier transferase [Paraburkholderia unamae]
MFRNTARAFDAFFVIAGALLAHRMRYSSPIGLEDTQRLLIAFNCALVLLLFPVFGIYETWRGKSLPAMLSRVAAAWLLIVVAGLMLSFTLHRTEAISRLWFGYATLISGALILSTKLIVHLALRVARRRGLNYRSVALVGTPGFTRTLLAHLEQRAHAGFKPVCVFDTTQFADMFAESHARINGLPTLTDMNAFVQKVREEHINEVWLALPLSEEHTIYRFTRAFQNDFVNLRFVPDTRSLALFNHSLVDVLGLPTISLTGMPIPAPQMWPKLVFDRVFSLAVLVLTLPLFAAIAVAIKLSSPGPVFFRQMRKGIDGRPFGIYKFRSMTVHREEEGVVTQATEHDARVTRVGAFLRRTSLDELPQFYNVLLGQMSVVGPRPHALEHDDLYKNLVYGYMHRYRIKPGITGWAQVNGYRGATRKVEKMETRVKFDLFYIHNWSFWFDIKIVLITLVKGFVGRNAY